MPISIPKLHPKTVLPKLWAISRFSIIQCAMHITRDRIDDVFRRETDLGLREFWILAAAREIPASQHYVAELLGINANVMVRMVDGLEKRGVLERVRNSKNRREYILRPTSKGVKLVEKIFAKSKQGLALQIFEPLSQEEIDTLAAYSHRIIDNYYESTK